MRASESNVSAATKGDAFAHTPTTAMHWRHATLPAIFIGTRRARIAGTEFAASKSPQKVYKLQKSTTTTTKQFVVETGQGGSFLPFTERAHAGGVDCANNHNSDKPSKSIGLDWSCISLKWQSTSIRFDWHECSLARDKHTFGGKGLKLGLLAVVNWPWYLHRCGVGSQLLPTDQ